MRFANASNREELLRFVRDFGPVVVAEKPPAPFSNPQLDDRLTIVEAMQSWKELESDHRLFGSLLRLLQIVRAENAEEELKASLVIFDEVLSCTSDWVRQYHRESSTRKDSNLERRAPGTGPKINRQPWVSTSGLRGMC